ncbi:MAG TPA: MmcQ/YjbR family DNA-binding protein [Gemmatimonadaceae bacterium]|nr:MmcQ/YjbR family DNA-binding protein [Gemmatimonadaceae bacterium]
MATQADVRRIALQLPGAEEEQGRFAFGVRNKDKLKGFAWVWLERLEPKKPRIPNPAVLAVRVANLNEKNLMIAAEPTKFFTEPHYNGYPAVLVRLAAVSVAELRALLKEAWRCQAPAALVKESSAKSRRGKDER